MNFLHSKHIHSLLFVSDDPEPEKVNGYIKTWGNKPCTIVTLKNSEAFQQELLQTEPYVLQQKYNDHLLVLTDAAWTDYTFLFQHMLYPFAQPKLLVLLLSEYDADLLPLLNLIRGNDRLPLLFDRTKIEEAMLGHIEFNSSNKNKNSRKYQSALFDPFDPYPIAVAETTEFTSLLYAVTSVEETVATFFNYNGSILFHCNSKTKKKTLELLFRYNGFVVNQEGYLQKSFTKVYIYCAESKTDIENVLYNNIDQLHVVEPPEQLARCIALLKKRPLTVYLYVPVTTPFEESAALNSYRTTFGKYVNQSKLASFKLNGITETILSLFIHNPVWPRAALVSRVQITNPLVQRSEIIAEIGRIIKDKTSLFDIFGTEGYVVVSENVYYFQPTVVFA